MNDSKICPFCGEKIKIVAIKCRHCGSMLNGTVQNFPKESTDINHVEKNKFPTFGTIALGCAITSLFFPIIISVFFVPLALIFSIVAIGKGNKKTGWTAIVFAAISFLYMGYEYLNFVNEIEELNASTSGAIEQFERSSKELERSLKQIERLSR